MHRIAAIVLLVGGALLMSWAVAPASSTTRPRATSAEGNAQAPAAGRDPSQSMSAEVQRLRERLDVVAPYPTPARDPFRFGASRSRAVVSTIVPPSDPPAPEMALPRLVAILDESEPGKPSWRAVLAIGDDVRVMRAGELVGGLEVRSVTSDGAVLFDPVSSRTFRVTLK